MQLLSSITLPGVFSQSVWQSTWEAVQNRLATAIRSVPRSVQRLFNGPEISFFQECLQEKGYQAYSNWCNEVQRAERLLRVGLKKKQFSPQTFRDALLQPVESLASSILSPCYYVMRLKAWEKTLTQENYPQAFRDGLQETRYRLREALTAKPELTLNYFYQDVLNQLIELSAHGFTAETFLQALRWYEGLVVEEIYQPVMQALTVFVKAHQSQLDASDEVAAQDYKHLIAKLNALFQTQTGLGNTEEEPGVDQMDSSLNLGYLALTGLALTGAYATQPMGRSGASHGFMGTASQVMQLLGTTLAPASFSYGSGYSWSLSVGLGSLSLLPSTAGQSTWTATFELSSLNGVNGFTINGVNTGNELGFSVASGDINGDGKTDVLIGSPYASPPGGRDQSGVSYVVFGHAGNFPAVLELSSLNGINGFAMNGVDVEDYAGWSIASGDINGDGQTDVLIGAYGAIAGGRSQAGTSYVVFGHTGIFPAVLELSTLNGTNGFTINGVNAGDCSGWSIASGDINGDGQTDVLIGAYLASPGDRSNAGMSYVVFGHTGIFPAVLELSALNGTNGFAINGVNSGGKSGFSIASGDIDGDGKTDVLIGASYASPDGESQAGTSYVVFGHAGIFPAVLELSTLNGTNGFTINGVNAGDCSGWSIASGDINGDGKADVLIGAPYATPGRTDSGASYVVFGRAGNFPAALELSSLNGINGFQLNGVNAQDHSGWSIASGDINGDGQTDVLIGAPYVIPDGESRAGASYVVFGHVGNFPAALELSSLNGINGFAMNGGNIRDYSGCSIASGDINGDGQTDVLIGALGAISDGSGKAGASYVVFGSKTGSNNMAVTDTTSSATPTTSPITSTEDISRPHNPSWSNTNTAIAAGVGLITLGLFGIGFGARRKKHPAGVEMRDSLVPKLPGSTHLSVESEEASVAEVPIPSLH